MVWNIPALLLIVFVLTGCGHGAFSAAGTFLPDQQYQALEIAPVCCATHRDIRYEKIQRGVETKVIISTSSPVFAFGGRRSYIAAFGLPPGSNRLLIVTTVPVNMLWNRTGHVMLPAIQFVSENYAPSAILQPRYQPESQFLKGSWAEAQIRVPDSARYVVLLDEQHGGGLAWRDRDQPSGSLYVRSGPTGEVSVRLLGR